ncbi:NADPH-dependent F420 reductase [Methanothrix sp.]|uniref:NADPH-dependent F420 reductase n=1 Tax=Methanothrix sp. TaxID=90426 RepID=UPI003C75238F
MRVALVGGTGDIGNGFAVRWSPHYEVIIGSRKAERARESAADLGKYMRSLGIDTVLYGTDNANAIMDSDVVVLCVPPESLSMVTSDLRDCYSDQIVISPVVPMARTNHFEYRPPPEGCAAFLVKSSLPASVRVVSAFHTIPARSLMDAERILRFDVPICGDDKDAKDVVAEMCRKIRDLRPLDAGPLSVSHQVEGLTPLLLNIARLNKMRRVGVQFVQEE